MEEMEKVLSIVQDLKESARVEAVFGTPETVGEKTIIPIAQVSYGLGIGFGEGEAPTGGECEEGSSGRGGGGGGGVLARPIAVLEVTPEGTRLIPVVDVGKIILAGICIGALCIFFVVRPLIRLFGQREIS
jgi:uncharacterized spore protein YtfJ